MLPPRRTIVEKNFLRRRRAFDFSHSVVRQDDVDGVSQPFPIRFSKSTREAFEVTSPRSSRGEVEICGTRISGEGLYPGAPNLRIEPLTPPSPRKNGARETRERGSAFSRRELRPSCA